MSGALLGVALDGHGYGDDGAPWGGELIVARRRAAGAASAISRRSPCRAATAPRASPGAWASRCSRGSDGSTRRRASSRDARGGAARAILRARRPRRRDDEPRPPVRRRGRARRRLAGARITRGRRRWSSRRWSRRRASLAGGWSLADGLLDLAPLFGRMLDERLARPRGGAKLFHGTLIAGARRMDRRRRRRARPAARRARRRLPDEPRARRRARGRACARAGSTRLLPRDVPANDGGLSLGQAAFAHALRTRRRHWMEE